MMSFVAAGRYGAKKVMKWKFETWNEPDLRGYNRLNFTQKGLLSLQLDSSSLIVLFQ